MTGRERFHAGQAALHAQNAAAADRADEEGGRAPRRGDRFEHSRQIVGDGPERRPAICTITRVTSTAVYFRNESGYLSMADPDRFAASVRRWLP